LVESGDGDGWTSSRGEIHLDVLKEGSMGRIGGGELLLILLIALLLFGSSKLADIGKGLGEGIKNLKKGLSSDDEEKKPPPAPPPPAPPPAAS
jgi:sec-independent protein translocase protein TatA